MAPLIRILHLEGCLSRIAAGVVDSEEDLSGMGRLSVAMYVLALAPREAVNNPYLTRQPLVRMRNGGTERIYAAGCVMDLGIII